VDVQDGSAALADKVVVGVFVRQLEVRPVASEVGAEQEALGDEELERAVDRGRVHVRQLGADALDDVLGTQMLFRLGGERLPDELALAREASPFRP